jgi:chromosome segregation ATPase
VPFAPDRDFVDRPETLAWVRDKCAGAGARAVALTQEMLTLQKSLAQVHGQLEEAKHHLDVDGHIISGVQEELDNLKTLLNKKMVEVKSLGDELQLVRTELKTATEEHLLFEGKHKDCQKRLEEVVRQYEALKEEERVLEEEHKTCQAAQPKPSADEEPPEDLSKPVQPNKVVCIHALVVIQL